MGIVTREAAAGDVEQAGAVVYAAFRKGADDARAFSGTAESPARSLEVVDYTVKRKAGSRVAVDEDTGKVVGFCGVQPIGRELVGLGPIAIDIACQSGGYGRLLLQSTLDALPPAHSVRLTVDTYNNVSYSLYSKHGFTARGMLTIVKREVSAGEPKEVPVPEGVRVVPLAEEHITACSALAREIARCDRDVEIESAARGDFTDPYGASFSLAAVTEQGAVVGYTTGLSYSGHTVSRSPEVFKALVGHTLREAFKAEQLVRVPLPFSEMPGMAEWFLGLGFRLVKHLILMTRGPYEAAPPGMVFLPTVEG
eukprot:Hpha_TRINITY_DN18456_c0_g1::TRINITY_DN18456_c0_g1_i1::g.165440::m.165440